MKPSKLKLTLTAVWCLLFAATLAGHAAPAGEKGGKELYKENCRACHEKNSPHGEYSPLSLIQSQWKTFFKTKFRAAHADAVVPGKNVRLLDALTPEQLKAVEKFCVDHAADSEQPQTCS